MAKIKAPFKFSEQPEIDWEARRWQAAVAMMELVVANEGCKDDAPTDDLDELEAAWAGTAIELADILIAEYRKQETTNAR